MRTTLDLDDDLLAAAKELARRERKSAGRVVSDLMRKGLNGGGDTDAAQPSQDGVAEKAARYGLRPFPSRGVVVTNEQINQLRDELGI
ncbi:MAG: hypothetical protein ACT4PG_07655 [Panacagrimonas sp.]